MFGQSKEGDEPKGATEKEFIASEKTSDPYFFQEAGDMLLDVYEGDADQLKVSAANFYKANYDFYGGGEPNTIQHSGDYSGPAPNMKPTPHTSRRGSRANEEGFNKSNKY